MDQDVDLSPVVGLVKPHAPGLSDDAIRNCVQGMPGGASTRKYFRIALPTGFRAVGMYVPEGAKPEEISKATLYQRWPFLEISGLLRERGIDTPRILGEATDEGWLLVEDLGERTLAQVLAAHPNDREALYVRAVRDLARAQAALATLPDGCVIATRAFDHDLLAWEIDHFREWGLDARGYDLTAAERRRFDAISDALASRIAEMPRGFVHRDYQSRNLMVREDGSLVWIDFQDALLGPRVYDLVALLNDSYQTFDRSFVEKRLAEYNDESGGSSSDLQALIREFDMVTVQRKLKDAGRFVFIDRVKHNPSFLRFVEPTIEKARRSLERLRDSEPLLADLDALLSDVLARGASKASASARLANGR